MTRWRAFGAVTLLAASLLAFSHNLPWLLGVLLWATAFCGILLYERAYIRAAQLPPLS